MSPASCNTLLQSGGLQVPLDGIELSCHLGKREDIPLDKQYIIGLLESNDKAIARALLVLNQRQTADEQSVEVTKYQNGQGFRPCHARMGSSMAKFYERNGYLSPKQIAYWRVKQKDGKMRIGIYAGQLLEIAQSKRTSA